MRSREQMTRPCPRRRRGDRVARLRSGGESTALPRAVVLAVFLALVAGSTLWSGRAAAADICFRPTSSVSASTVRLKDIATVAANDPSTMILLENIALAPAPAPGRRMRLEFAEIRSRVEASGIPASELNYSGSSVIVVAAADAPPKAVTRKVRKEP